MYVGIFSEVEEEQIPITKERREGKMNECNNFCTEAENEEERTRKNFFLRGRKPTPMKKKISKKTNNHKKIIKKCSVSPSL